MDSRPDELKQFALIRAEVGALLTQRQLKVTVTNLHNGIISRLTRVITTKRGNDDMTTAQDITRLIFRVIADNQPDAV